MGGRSFLLDDPASPLDNHLLSLAGRKRPHVALLPTAVGDADWAIEALSTGWGQRECTFDVVTTFGVPDGPAERVAAADVVVVTGGNTANMLAVWRVHGMDQALREAWDDGVVLCGVSAGMNCWFECSITDSFGLELSALRDGLGFIPGSVCPHYDGEERRRPVYRQLVGEGLPAGYAAEDSVGLLFTESAFTEAVAEVEGRRAYRIEMVDGQVVESVVPTRSLVTATATAAPPAPQPQAPPAR
jgi:peptidase E